MKKAEVQLPDGLYSQIEALAKRLHVTVADVLRRAVEQMITRPSPFPPKQNDWRFPEGQHLGAFRASVEDWRLAGNEATD